MNKMKGKEEGNTERWPGLTHISCEPSLEFLGKEVGEENGK